MTKTVFMNYRDLIAGQKAFKLALSIYDETSRFPFNEKYGLTLQLRRAAISVPSNIAEGEGRKSKREFSRYIYTALGSIKEAETQILISESLGYLNKNSAVKRMEATSEVGRLINGLIKSRN